MKKLLSIGLILGLISASYTASSQVQKMNEMTITPPIYQNSKYNSLHELLQSSVEYPANAINNRRQGTEVIRFTVSSSGSIEDIKVINSVSWDIDKEVIRALLATKDDWTAGTIDGGPTKMVKEVSLIFALNSFEDLMKTAKVYMQKGNRLMYKHNSPEKALKYYNKVQEFCPYETCVLLLKSNCLDQLGRASEAEKTREELQVLTSIGTVVHPKDMQTFFPEATDSSLLILAQQ